jgi:membrane protein YdbS with pleckstrin-like domain
MLSAMSADPFDALDVEWRPVSPRLATARRAGVAVVMVPVALVAAVVAVFGDPWWPWLVALGAIVVLGWSWIVIGRQVRSIGYAERPEELLVRHGVLWRTVVVVPYARLQYVDVQAGPIDRRLGIARLQLHTASAGTDAAIAGLPPAEAGRLRDRLTERGRSQLAGL